MDQMDQTEQEKSLVGYQVVLNPKMSGMYIDPSNDFTLSFFDKGKDRIIVTDKMDVTFIRKNISAGILFVYDKKKDVSLKYGGVANKDVSRQSIVKAPKKIDQQDDRYIKVINRNIEDLIIQDIRTIKDLPTLERIMELEQSGNNPSSQSRGGVIDAIANQIQTLPVTQRVGVAKETKKDKEEVVVK